MRISDWSSDVCSSDLGRNPMRLPCRRDAGCQVHDGLTARHRGSDASFVEERSNDRRCAVEGSDRGQLCTLDQSNDLMTLSHQLANRGPTENARCADDQYPHIADLVLPSGSSIPLTAIIASPVDRKSVV